MDVSTTLVKAYLQLNGYFTATEYPLIEHDRRRGSRPLTDIDLLAVRFDRGDGTRRRRSAPKVSGPVTERPDPALQCPDGNIDMIVGEIKQGRAQVNPAARKHRVLAGALARFGCCSADEAHAVVETLLRDGSARAAHGHTVRMVLFASRGERAPSGWHWIHLDQVFRFLDQYLRDAKATLRGVDFRDPALAWLSLLDKCDLRIDFKDARR